MMETGLVPDSVTFNTLIHWHCKEDNMSEDFRLANVMVDFGVMPDLITHNALINRLCRKGNMQEEK